jgi:hypothetical protein
MHQKGNLPRVQGEDKHSDHVKAKSSEKQTNDWDNDRLQEERKKPLEAADWEHSLRK